MVIQDDTIVCIGTLQSCEIDTYYKKYTKIDAKKSSLYPGFIDAHTHVGFASLLFKTGLDLSRERGKKNILRAIKAYDNKYPHKKVIFAFGVYPYIFGQQGPHKKILDDIIDDKPIIILSQNGHAAWMNSYALKLLNLTVDTIDKTATDHRYIIDKQGKLSGFMLEGASFFPYLEKLGIGSTKEFKTSFEAFLPQFSKWGVTTIFDAGTAGLESFALDALRKLQHEKKLPLRYVASYYVMTKNDTKDAVEHYKKLKHKYEKGLISVGAIKLLADGEDDDESHNNGHFIHYNEKRMLETLLPMLKNNISIMIHTSIDKSTHIAIEAIEKAKQKYPHSQSRITLSHLNMVRDNDFKRMRFNNIIANVQPFNASAQGFYEYRYVEYEDKYNYAWENKLVRLNNFVKNGVLLTASSDYPACPIKQKECRPLANIEIGMTRKTLGANDNTEPLDSPDEKLSLQDSLDAYTINAAYQLGLENEVGSIEVGKKADIILINNNLATLKPYQISKSKILLTISNGTIVYNNLK